MKKLLLLPSASLIPPELQVDFGPIPSGMAPLNSRPALHHIAAPYAAAGFEVAVAVHENAGLVFDYVAQRPELRMFATDVGPTGSIAETVATALHGLKELPDRLVINFADTLLGDLLSGEDVICYQQQEDLFRWTAFRFDEQGRIRDIYPKQTWKPGSPLPVFVGVFGISDVAGFLARLDAAVGKDAQGDDPFWTALVEYHNGLPGERRRLVRVRSWQDFGHLDTYYSAQRAHFLNTRYFNSMSVDLGRGVVRKSSAHADKLAQEVEWYLSLPPALRYLGPRVFAFHREPGQTSAEMEFYGYPALNDVYLFGQWDAGVWSQVLRAIGRAVDGMSAYRLEAPGKEIRAALREMYVVKTTERLRSILSDRRFAGLAGERAYINGQECMGLRRCLEILPAAAEAAGLLEAPYFTIIHGDLCLSNILYDRRSGFVRLVDPRGSFGGFTMYGDPRYDLAKLSHSLHGDYDFLLNGLFRLEGEGPEVELTVLRRGSHEVVRRLFGEWLAARAGAALPQIQLIESLLFLSMIPLHADRPDSQCAFLAQGLQLFSRIAGKLESVPTEVLCHAASYCGRGDHDGW